MDTPSPTHWPSTARRSWWARSADQLDACVDEMKQDGGKAIAVVTDVTDSEAVTEMVEQAERTYGPIDLLVNNAASNETTGPIWESDPDLWWQDVRSMVYAPFRCAHTVLPTMIRRHQVRIINIVSPAGTRASATIPAYSVSKTALIRLTECMALQLVNTGVSVFALSPGLVHTALIDQALSDRWAGPEFQKLLDAGLAVPPERAAALVVTLATGAYDALSGWYIAVGDDLEALMHRRRQGETQIRTLRMA
ncbi:MAG: SDR family NAD(P)-dependent oxidoreductase [Thermaerobacter sp.]|nr:SDR family NAD(P)-dependent oxidoreductase [Thermaerobacter sp.]